MQLDSVEAIKTAVSLGLGVAFVSSIIIQKEIELDLIKIIKINNMKINKTLSIISDIDSYKSKAFKLFIDELFEFKDTLKN